MRQHFRLARYGTRKSGNFMRRQQFGEVRFVNGPSGRMERPLGFEQALHVKAVDYWLALGEFEEAERELREINPNHPAVARARRKIRFCIEYARSLMPDERACLIQGRRKSRLRQKGPG